MTLKTICNSLSRRPQLLDVILLFRSPKMILQPLCCLLDAWRWDEDQGEYIVLVIRMNVPFLTSHR